MARDYDFIAHVTRFCRLLRAHGLLVGPADAASAISAIGAVDMMDYGRVYWTLRSVLVSRHEEIAVFDQLFERLWNFEPQPTRPHTKPDSSPFGGLRELRRRPATVLMPEADDAAENTLVQLVRSGASAAPSAEFAALHGERRRVLIEAVGQLEDADRVVIHMRYFLEFSEMEMAAALRCRPGTVWSRISRASRRLKALIESRFPDLAEDYQGD